VVRTGLVLLPVLGGLNVAANAVFFREARFFAERRIHATRHFDKRGTFANAPFPIFPHPVLADRIISKAIKDDIFQLEPRGMPPVQLTLPAASTAMHHFVDELAVGLTHVHIRGWLLPPSPKEASFEPHVVLQVGAKIFAFPGYREDRPDVAKAFKRPDAARCGFYFLVPRTALPKEQLNVSFALVGRSRTLLTGTGHKFVNHRATGIANAAGGAEVKTDD
jgi:hypothetical protein